MSFNIKGGFYIVSNVLEVRVSLPASIAANIRLEKADDAKIDTIHEMLARFSGPLSMARQYYENDWTVHVDATSTSYVPTKLDRTAWRYFVLAFSGNGNAMIDFMRGANLVEPSLSAVAHVYTEGEFGVGKLVAWGGDTVKGITTYELPHSHELEMIDDDAIVRIRRAYDALLTLNTEIHRGIASATHAFEALKRIPRNSDLRVLGLFAVVEMLLTHNPNDKELGDSLSHQIATKVPLLSARFGVPLDYGIFGTSASPGTVWKKLYEYRSAIAHGNSTDFHRGLRLLKSPEIARQFLERAVRQLLRHALDEPVLVDALKPI